MPTDETSGQELLRIWKDSESMARFTIEDYFDAIRQYVEDDLSGYLDYKSVDKEPPHPAVVAALEGCINHLGDAKMAYYASLK